MNLNITKTLVLRDFDYTINAGLASGVNGNLVTMNASLKSNYLKRSCGIIRLAALICLTKTAMSAACGPINS
jgi:hypothetical protein